MPMSILDGPLPPEVLFSDGETSDESDGGTATQTSTRRNTTAVGKRDSQQVREMREISYSVCTLQCSSRLVHV